ncbi:SOS response-associated peptidase, partial [Verrucomicrobia bacterium]|nr:SOS response-associated peptidase [Verrucomicrobiota bacterium]
MKSGRFGKLTKKAPTPDKPSLNRAPGQIHPTLSMSGQTVGWSPMWWGRPPGGKTGGRFPQPINARAETVGQKPVFRESFESKRCLVPADGFYEWQVTDGEKYPYFIHLPERPVFAMAGIWTEALDFEKTEGSFTIL